LIAEEASATRASRPIQVPLRASEPTDLPKYDRKAA
jgi:hypothetical protein